MVRQCFQLCLSALLGFISISAMGEESTVAHYEAGERITGRDVAEWWKLEGIPDRAAEPTWRVYAAKEIAVGVAAREKLAERWPDQAARISDIKQLVRRHYAVQLLRQRLLEESHPSDAEIQAAYESFRKGYTVNERLVFDHLFLETKRPDTPESVQALRLQAAKLRLRMLEGEPFARLAKEFSMAKSAASGGRSGPVPLGKISKRIEEHVLGLEDGEIGPIFDGKYGFHIFRRDRIVRDTIPSYEEKRDGLAGKLARIEAGRKEEQLRTPAVDDLTVLTTEFLQSVRASLPWGPETEHLPPLPDEKLKLFFSNECALVAEARKRGLETDAGVKRRLALWEGRECKKGYLAKTISHQTVTDEEVTHYTREHADRLVSREAYALRIIKMFDRLEDAASPAQKHLAQRATAQGLQEAQRRLQAGESFASVARDISEDASAEAGGDIGAAPANVRGHVIAQARKGLKNGDISGIVRGRDYGLIVQQVRTLPSRPLPPDEMRAEAERLLKNEKRRSDLKQECKMLLQNIQFVLENR